MRSTRVEEIRKLQPWRREHADKFKMNALHAACADIDYLLSLLPQLSSSEPLPEWSVEHPNRERDYWSKLGKQ
jgi:hypothetical protein